MMIQFSVIMAVYSGDSGCNVKDALDSLLGQSRTASEILIVVDGYIEVDVELVLVYFERESSIEIFRLPDNVGAGAARDFGIMKAKYDIIAIMDSDDICDHFRFEKQIKIIENGDADIVGAWIEEFNRTPGDLASVRVVPETHFEIYKFGKWRQPVNHVSIVFTRAAYNSVGGYAKLRYIEDYDFLVRLLVHGIKFYNMQETLVHVRIGDTINRRSGYKYLQAELKLQYRMYKWKYLSLYQFMLNIVIRLVTRLLPAKILKKLYNKILRKN